MTSLLRVMSGLVVATVCAGSAMAAHTLIPAPSTWTLNVAKCDFGGVPGMRSEVWHVLIDNEKRFKYTDVMVLESGETINNGWDAPQDGKMRPVPGMSGAMGSFTLADDSAHFEMKDGSKMDGVITLSADKKLLTLKMDVHTQDGKTAHQTLVYDRTK